MNKYIIHYRSIIVTPVHVEAETLEEATKMAREAEGDWQDDDTYSSNLSLEELGVNLFESAYKVNDFKDETSVKNEVDWNLLNEL